MNWGSQCPLEVSAASQSYGLLITSGWSPEEWSYGKASLRCPDMPAYPPGSVPPRHPISRGRTPETCIPRQWGRTKTLVTADGFPDARRSKSGYTGWGSQWARRKVGRWAEPSLRAPTGCRPRRAGVDCSWDQSVAWMWFDESSWPICGSHTVVPRSHDLIIIYQKYLIRDVGGERWPRNCTLLNLNMKPASFLPCSVFAISHLGWLHLPNKCF